MPGWRLLQRPRRRRLHRYPFESLPALRFRDTTHFSGVIRRICDWLMESEDGWRRSFWAPQLFAAAVRTVDDLVLDELKVWAGSNEPRRLEVISHLLREGPRQLVWTRIEWVTDLLERAYALGIDCYNNVASALHAAVVSGIKSGAPGEPFPEDIEQRDRSLHVAASFDVGSPTHRFYTNLVKSAEASIRWTQERHEEDRPD